MDSIKLLNLENTNKDDFLSILTNELLAKFKCTDIDDLPENYGYAKEWSLLTLIRDNKIDSYQLIFVNGDFWAGSGGMIRTYDNKKIYQSGFRAFSNATNLNRAIGMKSYSHIYNTKQQIELATKHNCESIILSFNTYNERLFKITRDYHLPKVFGKDSFKGSDTAVEFYGVKQWLLTMSLK
jgi:hypothetical protein